MQRTPRDYDGVKSTSHRMGDVLGGVLLEISDGFRDRPDLVLAAWPSLVGEKLAPMTQALSFNEGVLVVKVMNSTLYSLLCQKERGRLLGALKKQFPNIEIRALQFRMG